VEVGGGGEVNQVVSFPIPMLIHFLSYCSYFIHEYTFYNFCISCSCFGGKFEWETKLCARAVY